MSVKEAVFPFVKFPGVDVTLSPEMKSTGEVMSLDRDRGLAYLKSQLASGNRIPGQGNIFVSLKDEDKARAVPLIRQLVELGYGLYATRGTSTMLYNEGIKTRAVFPHFPRPPEPAGPHPRQGSPVDCEHHRNRRRSHGGRKQRSESSENKLVYSHLTNEAIATKSQIQMRSKAMVSGVSITTTIAALTSTVEGLMDKHDYGRFEVCSLQEYHRHIVK